MRSAGSVIHVRNHVPSRDRQERPEEARHHPSCHHESGGRGQKFRRREARHGEAEVVRASSGRRLVLSERQRARHLDERTGHADGRCECEYPSLPHPVREPGHEYCAWGREEQEEAQRRAREVTVTVIDKAERSRADLNEGSPSTESPHARQEGGVLVHPPPAARVVRFLVAPGPQAFPAMGDFVAILFAMSEALCQEPKASGDESQLVLASASLRLALRGLEIPGNASGSMERTQSGSTQVQKKGTPEGKLSFYLRLLAAGGAISGAIRGAKDSTRGNSAATKKNVQPSDATWALFSACRALSTGMALRAGRRHVTPVFVTTYILYVNSRKVTPVIVTTYILYVNRRRRAGPTVLAPEIAPGGRVLNRPDIAPEIERDRANLSLAPERGWIAPPLHASAATKNRLGSASGAKKKDLAPEIAPRLQAV
ncbi:hypothetical protein THAOC_18122 [Thalassiosira oceanica]|uniref:Uncharacterized protein n=1 Tax=Thalassiosira oceanica TaxID=159749 RepID=K0S5K6_THAOC|nr:hypothetical protein THAOC_18122 [Thalassiosira oceanica]|eukprot:EJK61398.1 hypothetical protein THAOC_18122 [Thalassiosira oceanica]